MVGVPKKKHLKPYDKFLKNFQYRNALDAALSVSAMQLYGRRLCITVVSLSLSLTHSPPPLHPSITYPCTSQKHRGKGKSLIVYSLLQELSRRDGLTIAISGRNEDELYPLLKFLSLNMTQPRYSPLLLAVCDMVTGKTSVNGFLAPFFLPPLPPPLPKKKSCIYI